MNVLITGASGGLGTAVCRAFGEDGATVIGVARNWLHGEAFTTIAADLTTEAGCEAMVREALTHGPIDALAHLMGGFGGGQSVAETDDQTWDGMMTLNLRAAFCAMRAALKPMMAAEYGRIVAVGSRAAVEPMKNFAAYSVSKAGLVALVKNVAVEGKDFGITANVVLPSVIDTPPNRKAMPDANVSKWVTPESIAELVVWLASKRAGDVSGAVIPIYGRS
ncbi:MAG TPA: SDR family NAD(P)-dependent oxidoreductase [Bryobacteraceae bacterium]|nr:SDR family NAD(P)-dependent oxidoreductase [Bryobacteraceae bacterium]